MMLLGWLFCAFFTVQGAPERSQHQVQTADGATLRLHRLNSNGAPILLVHGLSSNHHSFDLDGRGLAHDLREAGYDVWMLDLRGRKDSHPPRRRPEWTLDDYGRQDLRAAVEWIRTATGHPRVAYVGHSMGGLALAIYHHWYGNDSLGPCVVLGSPLTFTHPDPLLLASARSMRMSRWMRRVPSRAAAASASVWPQTPRVDALLFDAEGTTRSTRRAMYRTIVSPMWSGELNHLGQSVQAGRLWSSDGSIDYVASLRDWTPPLLVVAGRTDRIAPPDRVVAWMDATGGNDHTWWVAGTAQGYSHDFGHLDLILADAVSSTLHADLVGWLDERPW
ncbi:MAG TPA: hypothetical protein DFR83_15665 [Deltaproteobacteria bacterium]|nr:hypothetical protein [Deltaproteobacteria bacterium]